MFCKIRGIKWYNFQKGGVGLKIHIEEYIEKRIEENAKLKKDAFDWLKGVTKTVDELSKDEEIKI